MKNAKYTIKLVTAIILMLLALVLGIASIVYCWRFIGPYALTKGSFWIMLFTDHTREAVTVIIMGICTAICIGISDVLIKTL